MKITDTLDQLLRLLVRPDEDGEVKEDVPTASEPTPENHAPERVTERTPEREPERALPEWVKRARERNLADNGGSGASETAEPLLWDPTLQAEVAPSSGEAVDAAGEAATLASKAPDFAGEAPDFAGEAPDFGSAAAPSVEAAADPVQLSDQHVEPVEPAPAPAVEPIAPAVRAESLQPIHDYFSVVEPPAAPELEPAPVVEDEHQADFEPEPELEVAAEPEAEIAVVAMEPVLEPEPVPAFPVPAFELAADPLPEPAADPFREPVAAFDTESITPDVVSSEPVSTELEVLAAADAESTEVVATASGAAAHDLSYLETAARVAESLNLGFHLGSAVERIAAASAQGSEGVAALREAAWLIERYIEILERRPIGADLHASAVRLARSGDAIAGLKALADALDTEIASEPAGEPADDQGAAPESAAVTTSTNGPDPLLSEPGPDSWAFTRVQHVSSGSEDA